jgi:uncharacterized membrane protein YfcA
MRAHHSHGAVRWDIVKVFAPGLMAGTFGGTFVAAAIPDAPAGDGVHRHRHLRLGHHAARPQAQARSPVPGNHRHGLPVGTGIGVVSSLVAAGGGFLSIPFMVFCNVVIHQAVGTSAALGFPIAVAGAIGYVLSGWKASGLPAYSYIYMPALVGVVVVSMLVAPLGARFAHSLPVKPLKRAFGVFLALLALQMAWRLLRG